MGLGGGRFFGATRQDQMGLEGPGRTQTQRVEGGVLCWLLFRFCSNYSSQPAQRRPFRKSTTITTPRAGRSGGQAGVGQAGRQTASGRRGGRGSQGTPGHRGGGPGTAAKGKFHNDLVSDLVSAMPAFRAGMKKLRNGRVRASFAVCRESARLGR